MRYSQIRSLDVSNGLGVGVSLFTQGCVFRCAGCFNPETWDFNSGKEFTEETKEDIIDLIKYPYIERFSALGGEPLVPQNRFELACLIQAIKNERPDLKIWIYTGYLLEDLLEEDSSYLHSILSNTDVLIDGPFIQELKDISLPFCGSRNQRIIDVPKTLAKEEIVLLEV